MQTGTNAHGSFVRKLLKGATRTVVACAASYAVSLALHLPQPYWAMITALAILQSSTVQTLNAGRDQTVGAVIGAIVGVGAIALTLLTGHRLAVFFLTLLPLALATAWRPSLRLACVTLIIVVLVPSDASLFMRALDRVLEIGVGVASGVAVAYGLFRSRGQRVAYERGVAVLSALADQAGLVLEDGRRDPVAIDAGHERVARALDAALDAAETAGREGGSPAPHSARFATRMGPLLRRLHSDMLFIDRAVALLPDADDAPRDDGFGCRPARAAMVRAADGFAGLLRALAAMVAADRPAEQAAEVAVAQRAFDAAIAALDERRSLTLRFVLRLSARDADDLARVLVDGEAEGRPHPVR